MTIVYILLGFIFLSAFYWIACGYIVNKQSERHNDIIKRLINREPVTYAETGTKPKKSTEQFVAWGNTTVDMDEVDK